MMWSIKAEASPASLKQGLDAVTRRMPRFAWKGLGKRGPSVSSHPA